MSSASIETTPQEILHLICRFLPWPGLKSVRPVSKEFNHAAEVSLYRQIFLRRNMDSFCKLRMIASTPHLAKLGRAIVYSGKMLHHGDGEVTYGSWYQHEICEGLNWPYEKEDVETFKLQFTLSELHDSTRSSAKTISVRSSCKSIILKART